MDLWASPQKEGKPRINWFLYLYNQIVTVVINDPGRILKVQKVVTCTCMIFLEIMHLSSPIEHHNIRYGLSLRSKNPSPDISRMTKISP